MKNLNEKRAQWVWRCFAMFTLHPHGRRAFTTRVKVGYGDGLYQFLSVTAMFLAVLAASSCSLLRTINEQFDIKLR